MNFDKLNSRLHDITTTLMMVGTMDSSSGNALTNAREKLRVLTLEVNEKPDSLLSHLTSLTVAERETILRVAEIVVLAMPDEIRNDKTSAPAEFVPAILSSVEEVLRRPQG